MNQICFNTNKFLDRVSGLPDPEFGFPGKIRQKSDLTVYHDMIDVQFGGFFQILWKIFQGKGKNLKKSAIGTFNDRLC